MIRENPNDHKDKSCPRKNSKGMNAKIHSAHHTFHIGADGKLYSTDSHPLYDGVREFCIDKRNEENAGYDDYYTYQPEQNDLNYEEYEVDENTPEIKQCNTTDNGEALGPFILFCAMPILHVPKCCKGNEMINVRHVSVDDVL